MKLILKYLSGGQSPLIDFVSQKIYKESPVSNYLEGLFLGKNWNTRYDGKVNWNGGLYPSWLFIEPEWYKISQESSTIKPEELSQGVKFLADWFSSLFNNKPEPKLDKQYKEPKERPGIGKKGDR